ncbi:hypothetical protein DFP72DRAFT_447060 [Ephemerocybe angulata]|uniref:Uncharacterized protein n=1 Tax=Ephemerocybe angulata TaxID=980116 RepID=A0A8H6M499_9AGAR|nr:hypothetical protein DFP72DRAFT_447060 [Tulosesus angulatus]
MRIPALLVKHAQKIKELYMELPLHWYQTVTGVHFPLLERLKVIVPEVEADFGSMTIMNEGPRTVYEGRRWAMDTEVVDFSQCPILSTASVTGPFAHNLIILPWENIVNLRVSHVVAGDIPGILRRFPAVKQFWVEFGEMDTMDDDSDFGDDSSDDEDLEGSSTLEKLVLEGVRSWALADILGDVPQSSLKHLEITLAEHEYEIEDEEFQESELFQPILKLADTLQHLSIGLDKVESLNSTIRFLSSFQSLVSLELLPASAELGLDDAFFKSLLMKPDTLSHLEDITISDLAISIEDGTLLDILRHRGYGGQLGTHTTAVGSSRLKSLKLVAQSGIESQSALLLEDSTRADLMRMVKEGLSIHIEFGEDVLFC